VTGVGKFIFMDALSWKLSFILIAVLGWSVYIGYRQHQVKGILKYWENLKMKDSDYSIMVSDLNKDQKELIHKIKELGYLKLLRK
jgi:hypothetical protein